MAGDEGLMCSSACSARVSSGHYWPSRQIYFVDSFDTIVVNWPSGENASPKCSCSDCVRCANHHVSLVRARRAEEKHASTLGNHHGPVGIISVSNQAPDTAARGELRECCRPAQRKIDRVIAEYLMKGKFQIIK